MTSVDDLGEEQFRRAQGLALDMYRRKDPQYGSAWKRSLETWGRDFIGMRLQEDVSKFVSLIKMGLADREVLLDVLVDIQVYAIFGVMYLDAQPADGT